MGCSFLAGAGNPVTTTLIAVGVALLWLGLLYWLDWEEM